MSGFGYMSRTVTLSAGRHETAGAVDGEANMHLNSANAVVEIDDGATMSHAPLTPIVSNQYVVYSATYQVPAFYFTIHDSSAWSLLQALLVLRRSIFQGGSLLPLTDIVKTSLFRRYVLEGTETTSFSVSLPAASFPLLSQGDHPTLGTLCWYLHPCETSAPVDEVMKEIMQDDWTESQRLVRWMEAWFMVLGTVVNLKDW